MSDWVCFSCPLRGQMCSGQKLSKVLSQHFFCFSWNPSWLTSQNILTPPYGDVLGTNSNISVSGTAKWQCHVEEILPTWLQIPWFSWKRSGPINCTVVAIPFCGASAKKCRWRGGRKKGKTSNCCNFVKWSKYKGLSLQARSHYG